MATSRIPGHVQEIAQRQSGPLATARTTGKLLATQGYVVGVEIGGSGARQTVALANLEGTVLHQVRRPLEGEPEAEGVLRLIDELIGEVTTPERVQEGRILRVGVAVGGLVDARRGIVRRLHHTPVWNNFPLQDYMAERLEAPCIIDNNANAAALAEVEYGVVNDMEYGYRKSDLVALYIGLGRGIGGGLVVNGRIYHGSSSTAGEIGHLQVREHGPRCSCGGSGHLEAIASTQAIVQRMLDLSGEYPATREAIRQLTERQEQRLTTGQVFQLAADGNRVARQVVDEVQTSVGVALANIIHLVNPGIIILGGPVAQAGDLLISPLQARVNDLCLKEASEEVRIVQGKLGAEANIVGAITLALQDL